MTTDPWQHMLVTIEPAYDAYKMALEQGPRYVPILTYIDKKRVWEIRIHEQWHDGINYGTTESGMALDTRCTWCESQLRKWPDVDRWSWQQWHFKNRHDAEKFITLYYLKWQ